MGVHFKPYLPFVVPPLLKSAALDPELQVCDADEADDEPDEDGFESVTVAIRGQGNKRITIRTSALEEKATACQMLHSYAMELKEAFLPHVQARTSCCCFMCGTLRSVCTRGYMVGSGVDAGFLLLWRRCCCSVCVARDCSSHETCVVPRAAAMRFPP